MKNSKAILIPFLFAAVPAFADMAVQCSREGKNNDVYLDDGNGRGYDIEDKGNAMVGRQTGLRAKATRDSLAFVLDEGTSRKWIYEFAGMRECWQNDTSKSVVLTISTVVPGQHPKVRSRLACECAQD